jgi:hypothetical protein
VAVVLARACNSKRNEQINKRSITPVFAMPTV